ncbi:MAG: DUF2339 domain-containing protein [Candidatus Omnitrophica bacterium]|nr:DUF2339 domain-containing protein [Candidatus Omnitrophota bacterium]
MGIIWISSIVATIILASNKKLNVALYVILSILLGPLALIIAIIDQSGKPSSKAGKPSEFSGNVAKELNDIKNSLNCLQQRVDKFEGLVREKMPLEILSTPEPAPEENEQLKAKETRGFEFVFGKYWLNRIGAVILFLGVGFFISYAFKYLNAVTKISIGYLFAIAAFIWGNILEKKKEYLKISWGILGLAWGLAYLSTYALYYIKATQIIFDPVVEMWLLVAISFLAVIYNLKYRSWIVTLFTYILAFITAGMGNFDYSTIVYCTLLVSSIAFISYRQRWHNLMLFGACGVYLIYSYWIYPQLLGAFLVSKDFSLPVYEFQLGFSIVFASWLIFLITQFFLKPDSKERLGIIVTGILVNAAFFVFLGMSLLYKVKPHLDWTLNIVFWFLMILGAVYMLCSYIYKRIGVPRLIVANASIAATLIAMAIIVKFPRLGVAFFWSLEVLSLFIIGIYYREIIYRILGAALAALVFLRIIAVDLFSNKYYAIAGLSLKHNIAIFAFTVLCFYLLGTIVKNKKIGEKIPDSEIGYYRGFIIVASILLTSILWKEVNAKWLSLALAFEGILILGIGMLFKDKAYRLCALSVFALGCLRLILVDLANINAVYKIVSFVLLGIILLSVSFIYARFISKEQQT